MMSGMEMGVWRVLVFPQESVAREVACELATAGCRVVAVRTQSTESTESTESTRRLWEVSSLAVYPVPGDAPERLAPFLQNERRALAALARTRGGAVLTHFYEAAGGVPAFSRSGLVHEDAAARIRLPDPMPEQCPQPPSAPDWEGLDFGDPGAEIREAVAVAHRMYGANEAAPRLLEFLLTEVFAEETAEPDESTREFLADLVVMAHHLSGEVLLIPYLAELAGSGALSAGARTSLFLVLLGYASELDAAIVRSADWTAMGGRVELRHSARLRDETVAQIPGLLPLWDGASLAGRYVLASLAAFCPPWTASLILPRLADIPAPQGTARSDALALVTALLAEDTHALETALLRVAAWDSTLAEQLDSPHVPRPQAARAALAACVKRDLPDAMRLH